MAEPFSIVFIDAFLRTGHQKQKSFHKTKVLRPNFPLNFYINIVVDKLSPLGKTNLSLD